MLSYSSYLHPPDKALGFSAEEARQLQALDSTQSPPHAEPFMWPPTAATILRNVPHTVKKR